PQIIKFFNKIKTVLHYFSSLEFIAFYITNVLTEPCSVLTSLAKPAIKTVCLACSFCSSDGSSTTPCFSFHSLSEIPSQICFSVFHTGSYMPTSFSSTGSTVVALLGISTSTSNLSKPIYLLFSL